MTDETSRRWYRSHSVIAFVVVIASALAFSFLNAFATHLLRGIRQSREHKTFAELLADSARKNGGAINSFAIVPPTLYLDPDAPGEPRRFAVVGVKNPSDICATERVIEKIGLRLATMVEIMQIVDQRVLIPKKHCIVARAAMTPTDKIDAVYLSYCADSLGTIHRRVGTHHEVTSEYSTWEYLVTTAR